MPADLLNVRTTADVLGVHENTVRNWEKSGLLRGVKLPGSGFRRFPREEVERMRAELMSSYAPATELPDRQTSVTGTVVSGDLV